MSCYMWIEAIQDAHVMIEDRKVPCRELRIDLEPYHSGELIFRKFKNSVMLYLHDNSYPHRHYRVNRWTEKFNVYVVIKDVLDKLKIGYTEENLQEIETLYNKL